MTVRIARRENAGAESDALPEGTLWVLGNSIFIYTTLMLINVERLQPDMLVAAFVYLAAAIVIRIQAGMGGWLIYAALGAALAVGYFAKTVMFPLSFVFLGCAALASRPFARGLARTAVALGVFLAISGPFVWVLSHEKGRLTYGDVGKIGYAEYVNGATSTVHWQGGHGDGIAAHPTRMLIATPQLFEFGSPVGGTYPPWYDPSYWYEGIEARFVLRNQLRAIRYTIQEYAGIVPYMSGILTGFIGLALFARSGRVWPGILNQWLLWVPGAVALGLYGLVYVEARYAVPFFVLIWLALFSGLRFPVRAGADTAVRSIALGVALTCGLGVAWLAGRSAFRILQPVGFANSQVAEALHELGLEPGDRVASIGYTLSAYWAHLAGVQVVAEIPLAGAATFWSASDQVKDEVFTDFLRTGAKVVVTDQIPPGAATKDWQEIGNSGYFIHPLINLHGSYRGEKR